jgi:hypothetical protein
MAEIELLATELAWQSRHGVVVDWSGLTIKPTPGLTQHLVGLNPIGDSLLISLPLLNNSPDLLHRLGAWLEQRFSDEPLPPVVLNAAEWGWE